MNWRNLFKRKKKTTEAATEVAVTPAPVTRGARTSTHWRRTATGWEFLGAHAFEQRQRAESGHVFGSILILPGNPQEVLDRLAGHVHLEGVSAEVHDSLVEGIPVTVAWEQVEPFLI